MKFLSFYYTHKPGGFCKRLYRLLGALADKGHSVTYLCLDQPPANFPTNVDVQILPFPIKKRSGALFWGLFFMLVPFLLVPQVLRIKPDRYVLFSPVYSTLFLLAKLACPRPLILFFRSLPFRINRITKRAPWILFFSDFVDRIGTTNANTVVCMTEAMKGDLETFLGKKLSSVEILPNEVSLQSQTRYPSSTPPFTLLTSGVLDERKNIGFLLQAIAGIDPQTCSLLVAGEGPLRASLEKQATDYGLTNVTFLGWQADLSKLYSKVDLVIHPALHEGVPNSVLEALGYGLPVLCSNIPEHSELLVHTGLLFTLDDDTELRQKILQFTQSESTRVDMQALSKEVAQHLSFPWEERAMAICEK